MAHRSRRTFEEPLAADPVGGEVAIIGPGHMHGAFTASAARESAEQLLAAAAAAEAQEPTGEEPT